MNKLTKLLSVFVIAGAVGAGVAGISACKKEPTTPTPPVHEHTASTEWDSNDTKHWHNCTADDGYKFDEANHVYDGDQDTDCNVCGHVRQVSGGGETGAEVPANAIGVKVTLINESIELNATNTFATLSLDDIEASYIDSAQNVIEGATVDLSKCTIEIEAGKNTYGLGDHLTKGNYIVWVLVNDDVFGTANLSVTDPVKDGSLTLKGTETPTQVQGADTISSSLAWEVELASGAKEDVTGVIVTGVDTYGVGENKTANAELVMDGKTLTKSFNYTVTDDASFVVQSSILNVNKLTQNTAGITENQDLGNGLTITAKSGKVVKIDGSNKSADGKAFTQRLNMQGSPIKSGALDGTTIFRTLQFNHEAVADATSAKTIITLYVSSSSAGAARQIALFKQAGTNGTDATLTQVGEAVSGVDGVTKVQFTVTEAGTYHVTSLSSGWYIHYVRVDKIIEGGASEEQPINATAGETLASLEKTVPSAVQTFTVGDVFSSAGIQVLGVYANDVTCDVSKRDVSAEATYSGYDMSAVGKQTVTISYGEKTTTYSITVESEVKGVYGATATLKSGFVTEIPASSSDTTITIKKSDIVTAMEGENADATISYVVKEGDTVIDDTTGLALTKGAHTLTVEITVSAGDKTYSVTKEVAVTITKEGEASPVSIVASNLTAGSANLTADEVIADETLAKVTLLTGCKIEANTGTVPYTNRIKTNGGATATQKAIKIEVTAGCTVTVLYKKGSADTRQLSIYNSEMTALQTAGEGADSSTLFTFTYTITTAGTYYLGGDNGINVFEINLVP
ncbi:MAG: bacterial Ig-like domain-containing protein [Candidatus Coproplasma sp.]